MILHALEHDQAIARRFNHLAENLEAIHLTKAKSGQLVFNQPLGAFLQTFLHLTNANGPQAPVGQCIFWQQAREKL